MKGYLKFYRSVKYLQRHPFCIKSLFLAVILALTNHLSSACQVSIVSVAGVLTQIDSSL